MSLKKLLTKTKEVFTFPLITAPRCIPGDREAAQRQIDTDGHGLTIVKEIAAPWADGRFHFHVSQFLLSDLATKVSVFHVKPVYYSDKNLNMWPLEDVCEHHGNKDIVLKQEALNLMHPEYLRWLTLRCELLGGHLSIAKD